MNLSKIAGSAKFRVAACSLFFCLLAAGLTTRALPRQQASPAQSKAGIEPEVQAVLDRISENSLRGHLSFIASDALEGRATPSVGLNMAAEYIAAQFRRAGVEPAGDAASSGEKSYFQSAVWTLGEKTNDVYDAATSDGSTKMRLRAAQVDQMVQTGVINKTVADQKETLSFKTNNVVGILRGSDPALKDTYVMVTAHYDHIGVRAGMAGDTINNGANDDGSGTVSVIELATALASMKTKPKRSIVFVTFFGEERGLLGSRYYGKHPAFPLEKTVADVNLEHVGRTDDSEGDKTNSATLTGFDFSDMGPIFKKAGELTGINVYKHEKNSDSFFGRSDNQAMADAGVPAHTLCVAFIFPDYHQVGDHWEKINYANLAKTNRMVALALTMIANNSDAPKWNEANPKTERYVTAWKKLQGK
ncbi:MAG TPA: M28 family peptidase [Blastocatellia bacterium]|nr:M28 family peptidase [Blastocatellia bacterium]HMV87907.1 M28 family peptidase [Blastocatellia bacterium]HMX27876.1 M28 family peptidase [Blastocatellia bacterium]HMY70629.1 M28 family peptidase [Blastocatellia bacterium]HMZ21201.1 M28 family peptidase [Blastocatellia bacterium]